MTSEIRKQTDLSVEKGEVISFLLIALITAVAAIIFQILVRFGSGWMSENREGVELTDGTKKNHECRIIERLGFLLGIFCI